MSSERSFTAMAWNVRDGFSDPRLAPGIVNFVTKMHPDVAVFSEATPSAETVDVTDDLFFRSGLGYWTKQALYNDDDGRSDRHGLYMIASRAVFQRPERFRAAGRTSMSVVTLDGEAVFIGMHAYDRDQSSKHTHDRKRVEKMKAVTQHLGELEVVRAVIGGDLNAMSPDRTVAKLLGAVAPLTRLLPSKNPGEQQTGTERVGSLANRLSYMALGGSLTYLQENGFVNADPEARGTMHFGPIHADLDHFMGRGVEMSDFIVYPHQGLSDHDAISVTVRY